MLFYVLAALFTVWMGVEAYRRGQANPWLWIILIFPPLGAVIYFFAEYLRRSVFTAPPRVSRQDLLEAEADVRRLDTAAAWADYASALRARKQYAEAADAARMAVEKDVDCLQAHYDLGRSLLELDRPGEAIAPLETVREQDPAMDTGYALFALANAYAKTGDVKAARAVLEDLVERSSQPRYLYSLAMVQESSGDREAASRSLQRIIDEAEYVPDYLRSEVMPWVRKARSMQRKLA